MLNAAVNTFGQSVRILPNSVIFGKTFRKAKSTLADYTSSQDPEGFIADYQRQALELILSTAQDLPYYKKQNINLDINHFSQIPFIDKAIMREDISQFIVTTRGADYGTTGGTSGKPFGFYMNKDRKGAEWFWMTNNWSRVGFDLDHSYRAVLRNHILKDNQLYVKNGLLREYIFSNYNLTDDYLKQIIDFIDAENIEYIHAYPSAAHRLAKYLSNYNMSLPKVKAFLCGSENVYPDQRQLIENELGMRIYSWYGHSEKLILAGECEHSDNYHAIPFYGYSELIDEDGNPIDTPGEIGELVGTGFLNTKMPFVRYRTGDYAQYVGRQCPACGRHGLIFREVQGRWDGEKVFANDGTYSTTTALNMHSDVYQNIKGMQYYQDTMGLLEVHVIPDTGFSSKDEIRIRSELLSKLGGKFELKLVKVTELQYTKNRKYKLLIQNLEL